jgi:hypothetical protein
MALTDLSVPLTLRKHLMAQSLVLSMHDGGTHDDGTGISDGYTVWKTGDSAAKASYDWWPMLEDRPIVGHVRKKSIGTGVATAKAAHPFMYKVPIQYTDGVEREKKLVLAHNGHFAGVKSRPGWKELGDRPDSDTFFAGQELAALLEIHNTEILTKDIIEEWLSNFAANSTFSLLIMYDGRLTVVRGKDRPLALFPLAERRFYINTSFQVATHMHGFIRSAYPDITIGDDVAVLAENTAIFFGQDGVAEPEIIKLEYTMQPSSYTGNTYQWSAGGWRADEGNWRRGEERVSGNAAGSANSGKGNSAGSSGAKTQPLGFSTSRQNAADAADIIYNDSLRWLQGLFQPLRMPLLIDWIWKVTGNHMPCPATDQAIKALTADDLEQFLDTISPGWSGVAPIDMVNSEILTSAQRRLINLWNHRVGRQEELISYYALFGNAEQPFWMDPDVIGKDEEFSALIDMYSAG